MSDERHQIQQQQLNQHSQQLQRRHNCCRLCLAPDNECISILNSYAADKEPLASKIHTCVSVKISNTDNLSLRICHACISYLNSWQSFKNRCLAAQAKQCSWLEASNKPTQSAEQHHQTADSHYDDQSQHQQQHHQQQDEQSLASSILEGISTLKKRKSLTVYVSPKSQQTKHQQEHLLQKQQHNVVMPLTKRHYTKHKYNKSLRQSQSQVPHSVSQTTTTTQHVQALSSRMKQKSDKKQTSASQQPLLATCSSLQPLFVIPAVPSVTATVTSCTITASNVTTTATARTATATTCLNTLTTTTLTTTAMTATSSSSVETIAVAAAAGLTVSAGSDDECLVVGSHTSSSSIACTSAVQQLRLFRRYSYNPLPAVQIKDEPVDVDEDYSGSKHQQHDESDDMVVDPTMFLERTADEGEFLESTSNYDYETVRPPAELKPLPASTTIRVSTKEAACRACNLKFSTRANARRHEKNLHPNLFETLEENDQSINKQTAALNASLELQRAVAAAVAADACKLSGGAVITAQKYRQEVVNAFNNSEFGFDYDNPEKYRELLTDEKIIFLQQNDEFLRQYQNMTCRCCNKYYSTYKNFMAHMRKKYLTLPRNCCFNCLKLNDSKALFISHLKKRNCINLHKVLHNLMARNANFAAAVTATVAAAPEKVRAKELLVNKMYECKLCPKTFRLKLEFRSHVYDEHADVQRKDVSNSQCCYCAVDIEDPADRKRHYNNMDCIVTLRCVTCDTKHETQQKFMEHVQEKHLANFGEQSKSLLNADNSPGKTTAGTSSAEDSRSGNMNVSLINTTPKTQYFSRMPQACPICGQQYNNYNNVLRHMESKHPDQLPQTYKCVKCGQGYPRLSNLREHMVSAHGADKARHTGFEYIVNADAVKTAPGTTTATQNPYTGRYDYVMKDLMSITNGGTVAEEDCDSENASKKMRLDTNISANNNNGSVTTVSQRECSICNAVFANNIGLSNHMRSHQSAQNSNYNISTSKAASGNSNQQHSIGQQQILRKSLEQAADRRFRRMRCRICQRRFSSKKSYRYHMLNDHQIRNVQFIKCKLCDAEFAYEKGLKVHMFKIHNTLLKDDMIIKQYECEICSIVYRTDVELQHHLANVHNKQGEPSNIDDDDDDIYNADESSAAVNPDNSAVTAELSGVSTPINTVGLGESQAGLLYWYQCKYCPSNFNTNKKLAIHINSHDEFDSNDYSCKDCGNLYSGRKSLWVHRYKKHPQIPEPSECIMCKKVFFDNQMLENHIPSCNRKPITQAANESATAVYKHKTGDDEDEDDDQSRDADNTLSTAINATVGSASNLKIKLPEVACTICGARFTDQDLFAKHIQMHEMELYTDNPLAAMFDTGPADPNQFYMDRINDNGEYACDLCAKTFTQMTALKVHRKWHFRGDSKQSEADQHTSSNSHTQHLQQQQQQHQQVIKSQQQQPQHQLAKSKTPISHQHLLGLQAVGLMPRQFANMGGHHRSQKRKRELKCPHCPSTFISNNNLRRHLFELHKNEMGYLPEPPKIECDPPNMCRRCNVKFETKGEWIEHKVGEARIMRPFGPFQWGCDLCGAYVSRKEKLINHLHNHMKDQVIVPAERSEPKKEMQQHSKQVQKQEQLQKQSGAQSHRQQQHQSEDNDTMPEFKKIKIPSLAQKQEVDEESRDSAKDQYYDDDDDEDEDDDGEGDDNNEVDNNENKIGVKEQLHQQQQQQQQRSVVEEYDEDDEDEAVEGAEFDDLAVGAQQTVGGDDDVEDDDDGDGDEEEDDEDDSSDADDEDPSTNEDTNETSIVKSKTSLAQPHRYNDTENDDVDDDDDSDEFDDDEDDNSSTENRKISSSVVSNNIVVKSRYSCDLCQVYFDSQQELQKHVKMHFLNGPGSVTLTEIKSSKSSTNKSRSSSSDVVAV